MGTSVRGLTALLLVAGCGGSGAGDDVVARGSALDHGRLLFSDAATSPSPLNVFTCATCHPTEGIASPGRKFPGAALAGALERPSYWGGQENDLLTAVNQCRVRFMDAQDPWTADDLEARAMWAFLESLPARVTRPAPFTVVRSVEDLPAGDAGEGAATYASSCAPCHGRSRTGEGRIDGAIPRLPDDTLAEHADDYSPQEQRVVFIEKTRHGGFLGYGGRMPPFSVEVLSDGELGGLLAYLELYREPGARAPGGTNSVLRQVVRSEHPQLQGQFPQK